MILRIGKTGPEVAQVQQFLGLIADGIFGPKTHAAVCKWQRANDLIPDGIVGPRTWEAMDLVSTDDSEKSYVTSNGLVVNKNFMPGHEYCQGPVKPEWVFLHHTAGWNNPFRTINNWAKDTRGRIATEFVLGGQSIKGNDDKYDGVLVQAFPQGNWGYHLGKNGSFEMHKKSVGIEVNNFGYIKDGKTYAGTVADPSQIVTLKKKFRGYKDWHRYSDAQIESLRLWILWSAERDNVDVRAGLPALIKEKGADAFEWNEDAYYGKVKGLWTHTNVRKDKSDMFPQEELMDMLVSL